MAVNFNKNRAQILDAWKKVTENEDGYDWALFGYEGRSFDLKVVSHEKFLEKKEEKFQVCANSRRPSGLEASKRWPRRSTMAKCNTLSCGSLIPTPSS